MLAQGRRQFFKHTLSLTRVRILYERITLTRFTAIYFFVALIACIILSALEGITFTYNSEAVFELASATRDADADLDGLAVLEDKVLRLCPSLPSHSGTICVEVINFNTALTKRSTELARRQEDGQEDEESDSESSSDEEGFSSSDEEDDDAVTPGGVPLPPNAPQATTITVTSIGPSTTSIFVTTSIPLPSVALPTRFPGLGPLPTITFPEDPEESDSSDDEGDDEGDEGDNEGDEGDDDVVVTSTFSPMVSQPTATPSIPTPTNNASGSGPTTEGATAADESGKVDLSKTCIVSLKWLNDVVQDDQREDVVKFLYQIWLFVVSFLAVLNESIPQLGIALLGHTLGTVWSGYRVYAVKSLMELYHNEIIPKACNSIDPMGDWWTERLNQSIPGVAIHAITLLVIGYLSCRLYAVYADKTFARVGASLRAYKVYKLVLVFSVCLQLAWIFTISSAVVWIDKVTHAPISQFARHLKLYLAAFIVILVVQLPWMVLGWICFRRESNIRFIIFCIISILLLGISSTMFFSELYRYIFTAWPFFAMLTVTSYILLAVTIILGFVCRFNFGKGLAEYLRSSEELDASDFAPVYVRNGERDEVPGNPTDPDLDVEKQSEDGEQFDDGPPPDYPVPLHSQGHDSYRRDEKRAPGLPMYRAGTQVFVPDGGGSSNAPPAVGPSSEPLPRLSRLSRAFRMLSTYVPAQSTGTIEGSHLETNSGSLSVHSPLPQLETDLEGPRRLFITNPSGASPRSTILAGPVTYGLPANPRGGGRLFRTRTRSIEREMDVPVPRSPPPTWSPSDESNANARF